MACSLPTKFLHAFLISVGCVTSYDHFIPLDFMNTKICAEGYSFIVTSFCTVASLPSLLDAAVRCLHWKGSVQFSSRFFSVRMLSSSPALHVLGRAYK